MESPTVGVTDETVALMKGFAATAGTGVEIMVSAAELPTVTAADTGTVITTASSKRMETANPNERTFFMANFFVRDV